jgi:hypothetical protein
MKILCVMILMTGLFTGCVAKIDATISGLSKEESKNHTVVMRADESIICNNSRSKVSIPKGTLFLPEVLKGFANEFDGKKLPSEALFLNIHFEEHISQDMLAAIGFAVYPDGSFLFKDMWLIIAQNKTIVPTDPKCV